MVLGAEYAAALGKRSGACEGDEPRMLFPTG